MGYDLYITRAEFNAQNEGAWISSSEWLQYIEQDPELKLAGHNGDYFAIWSGKSEHTDPWLNWFEGNIYTKNPDGPLIEKMVEIASKLGATVQGEEGEIYTSGSTTNIPTSPKPSARRQKSWFRRLLGGE